MIRRGDTHGRVCAILHKGDDVCDILFVLPYIHLLFKKGSTLKEKNLLPWGANFLSFNSRPLFRREIKHFDRVVSLNVHPLNP